MAPSELDDRLLEAVHAPSALTQGDVGRGLALSDAAGWNQTAEDWALFIAAGRALGIRDGSGLLVATAATLHYGARAWISLVLVDAAARHRGLASGLMRRCIAVIEADGAIPCLDATPAGASVYRTIGFLPGFEFERWQSNGTCAATTDQGEAKARWPGLEAKSASTLDSIAKLDREASGLERRSVLASLLGRPETRAWLAADGKGFVIAREGRRAWQIGPLVAADDAQAIALLDSAVADLQTAPAGSAPASLDPAPRAILIDVPTQRRSITGPLAQRGFVSQRPFVRMALGAVPPPLDARSFALAGPEYG
ncbi:MAG: hypothetical protein M3Z29_01935 [Pseudomonadota bacterium]|nr:hypothetical protein [Pseudomonadota bacterium]